MPGVDRGEHGFGIGQAEMGGDPIGQHGRPTPAVAGSQGQAEGPHAEPRTPGGEVAGQFGQGGEPLDRPVGTEAHTVEARTADHPDPPSRPGPGPKHGQGVVADQIRRRSIPGS